MDFIRTGFGTAAPPHAVDPQSEDSPQDDPQSAAVELSEMPVSVFYRSGPRAPPVGISRARHVVHAGSCQSRPRWRSLPHLRQGKFLPPYHLNVIIRRNVCFHH